MNIGIIDADLLDNGTRHPNLALMKISGYMKAQGHEVELLWNYNNLDNYNKVYLSKVFSSTNIPININDYSNIEYGGTGFYFDKAPDLSYEIEHHMPDYHLYDNYIENQINNGVKKSKFIDYFDHSIGFATRGCFRKCDFCVNKKYDKAIRHSAIAEFYDPARKYIYLWDDNILAYEKWHEVFEELAQIGRPFQFRQGLDIRLMTEEKAKAICQSKYHKHFSFAFDSIKDKELIINKLKLWRKYTSQFNIKKDTEFYILCAYERTDAQDIADTFERIKILMEFLCVPYIMRYKDYKDSEHYGMYVTLARWCNQPSLFKRNSFRQFVYEIDKKQNKNDNYASKRYLEEFERKHPEIAKKYFDLNYYDYLTNKKLS